MLCLEIFRKKLHFQIEFFNTYQVYMEEFKIAMKTLKKYEESHEFQEVLTVLHQNPLCERLNLASYLLNPVQRLPRYELLLKVNSICMSVLSYSCFFFYHQPYIVINDPWDFFTRSLVGDFKIHSS